MKALTLHQPWASLIALGAKCIETRSWRTNYRGPLAIHAGQAMPPGLRRGGRLGLGDYNAERDAAGLLLRGPIAWPYRLPLGAVVATCELVGCVSTENIDWKPGRAWIGESQRPFGDYAPGRFAWLLDNIAAIKEPIPAKGRQGLWEWTHGCYICQEGEPWADNEDGCSDCDRRAGEHRAREIAELRA